MFILEEMFENAYFGRNERLFCNCFSNI